MPKLISRHKLIANHPLIIDGFCYSIANKVNLSDLKKPNSCALVVPSRGVKKEHFPLLSLPVEDVVHSLSTYVRPDQYIIMACWIEPFFDRHLQFANDVFSKLIEDKKFNREKLIILVGALPVESNYDKYIELCAINNWQTFPIIFHSFYEEKMFLFVAKKRQYNTDVPLLDLKNYFHSMDKNKLFLFFNGVSRSHRHYLLLKFASMNILDNFLYSYITEKEEVLKNIQTVSAVDQRYKDKIGSVLDFVSQLEIPKYLTLTNDKVQTDAFMISDDDIKLFDSTYISIISETMFFKHDNIKLINAHASHLDSLFLTEKTFRAIACKHPFMIVTRPHILKALRELGYKTYSPWIDESYDDIEDDYERLDKLIEIISDLSKKDKKFWTDFYHGTREIAEYNFNVLFNNGVSPFKTSFHQ
jgi:hypothetical protein